ncbi:hypothetical protein [Saccharothrix variisporea]|uniref:Microbial transglutaminase n=1 Tax=Saccharothrix variisporea TaxID=543527 RepID=A0A495X847_9PSEU|nr:hypothetical protein [Saccharothrix variisporea]RKT67708.1 microbial transglutaminase [Saccharothrix variisporea]
MPKWFARVLVAVVLGLGVSTAPMTHALAAPPGVTTAAKPIAPALPPGVSHLEWEVADYVAAWERQHGRAMTDEERATLARGCIGVTVVNLERDDVVNPPLGLSFDTFARARAAQAALNEVLASRPTPREYAALVRRHPLLSGLRDVVAAYPSWIDPAELTASVFSKRFWRKQDPSWTDEEAAAAFRSDPGTGQVDMSKYRYVARPGYVNFDYGWYDEDNGNWWHANHAEPGMVVYQSTKRFYSRPLLDFDAQVYSVAFARVP